ncbi:MAG: cytochrome c biogenesis CcdA family protein [Chloroflexota bacterium]
MVLAIAAGVVSFLSPCVVPLVPGYLAFVSGVAASEREQTPYAAERMVLGTVLFVLGFTAVFVVLGTTAAALGSFFDAQRPLLSRVAGVVMISMGLLMLGFVRWTPALREWRLLRMEQPVGLIGALGLGAAFGLGWTPCIGPMLASILALASTAGHLEEGALLLFSYSIGLGLPFLIASLLFARIFPLFRGVQRYSSFLTSVSGVAMLALGTLFILNQSFYLNIASQRLLSLGGR